MKTADVKKIRKKMEKTLDAKRCEHTLGVAYTASALAMCHGEDINKAMIAGLLHDCAKCIDGCDQCNLEPQYRKTGHVVT